MNHNHKILLRPIAGVETNDSIKRIAGKYEPGSADDVTINAKKGEYYISPEDVALIGGPEVLDAMIKKLRAQNGQPTTTGPKTHNQPDRFGRKDKPWLRGIAGLADGGPVFEPYETDPHRLAGIAGSKSVTPADYISGAAGWIGNKISDYSLTDSGRQKAVAALNNRIAGEQTPSSSVTPTGQQPVKTNPASTDLINSSPGSLNSFLNMQGATPNRPQPISPADSSVEKLLQLNGVTPENAPRPPRSFNVMNKPSENNIQPIADGGSGFAQIGNRRIDYRNIGIAGKDLIRAKGGFVYAPGGDPSGRDVDWSPGSANNRAAISDANRKNGMMTDSSATGRVRLMTHGEALSLGLVSPQQQLVNNNKDIQDQMQTIAGNMGNDYDGAQKIAAARLKIAGLQTSSQLLQQGIAGDQSLEAHKYTADQDLIGKKYGAAAGILSQGIAGNDQIKVAEIASGAKRNELQQQEAKEAKKQFQSQIENHLKSQGADPGDLQNQAMATKYNSDSVDWGSKVQKLFNGMRNGDAYYKLYIQYMNADPAQRATMEGNESNKSWLQIIRSLGPKYGVDPFARPAPPKYRLAPIKLGQMPIDISTIAGG